MPNSSNNYKSGELCDQPGRYQCLDCQWAELESTIEVKLGVIFPYCKSCPPPHDATWHLLTGSAS
jgi:hypothetical protein